MARQVLIESLLLASVGGGLGWWIARWGLHIWNIATESRYQILDYTPGSDTVTYLAATSIIAAMLFSVVPIVRIWRLDVNGALKSDARGSGQALRGKYAAGALVAVQMALAIILLSGAGVLLRSFMKVVKADIGLKAPEKVLVGHVSLPRDKYPSLQSRISFFDQLKARLMAIPGVEAETLANTVPPNNPGFVPFELEASLSGVEGRLAAPMITTGPGYIRTMGAATVAGRDFKDPDLPDSPPVAMVNQSFAARYWPGQNALGKRLRVNRGNTPGEWRTVVGVVTNIKQGDPTRQTFLPVIYTPFRQDPAWAANFFVRTGVPTGMAAGAVQDVVRKLDPDITFEDFSTLAARFAFRGDLMDIEHSEMGKHAAVAPIFAAIALLLAAIGLYAVIAHSVSQRTKEIGIRMAIGAAAMDIRRLIFGEGMLPVAIGLAIGLVASLGVNRILQSQLVGVSPYDPVTFALGAIALIAVALIGCGIPVRRAMRVDPAVALRQE
jgi:predicted permease